MSFFKTHHPHNKLAAYIHERKHIVLLFCGRNRDNGAKHQKSCVEKIRQGLIKKKEKKIICNDVSVKINPCELVAVIGGSGAGKSTVMNCISGYSMPTDGQVYVNGIDLYENFEAFKNIIGYVPQSDIVYENLTIIDMLKYTANLRLPNDTSEQEKDGIIESVVDTVELSAHKNTLIRELSGGQRKRASIAVELLSNPNLFFLDEPASGLDPGTERNLTDGVLWPPYAELFATIFLTSLSASSMGIFVSSLSKNADRAMTVAPLLLMPQILFSGLIFVLGGAAETLSWATICRWSMEGFGTTANLNALPLKLQEQGLAIVHEAEKFYDFTGSHLLSSWGILGIFIVVFSVASGLVLRNIKND